MSRKAESRERKTEGGNLTSATPHSAFRIPHSRGTTLIELLLVLTLLVVIGSLTIPIFTGSFSSARLRRAGDQVITAWAKARARAIESGDVMQFRFQPETGSYRVEAWTGEVDGEPRSSAALSSAAAVPAAPTANIPGEEIAAGASVPLPDQIVFQGGRIATVDPLQGERRVDSMQSGGSDLSTPLLFFPDGTTSSASVSLANDRQQYVQLTLRGLTGVARASAVLTREELEQASRGR